MLSTKQKLHHWCTWFFAGNIIIFWLVGINYLLTLSSHFDTNFSATELFIKSFTAFAYIGHLGLLALIPVLFILPLVWIWPKHYIIIPLSIVTATLAVTILSMDALVYKMYHFHLYGIIISMFLNGGTEDDLGLSKPEYGLILAYIITFLIIETIFAIGLWFYVKRRQHKGFFTWLLLFLGLSWGLSYSIIVYGGHHEYGNNLTNTSRFLPFYDESLDALSPKKSNPSNVDKLSAISSLNKEPSTKLNYPLSALTCQLPAKPKNVLVIVIDTWRFDMLNQEETPNLLAFSKQAALYTHHFSGGNSTGPGIFSLFYGMPIAYWSTMANNDKRALMIDEFIKNHYQMGIFSSATLKIPAFNETVFRNMDNVNWETEGASPYDRDKKITQEFKQFIIQSQKNSQPFFSFLFYDSAHSYCAFNEDLSPLKPSVPVCNRSELGMDSDPTPYFNRYKNALILIDQQIKEVLETLKANNLLDNTVVVITGDHGEEFNDNHLGFWGHSSNFTHYQTQTPLIVYWPQSKPQTFSYQTSHFDIAPTLLHEVLGCSTPPNNYSFGQYLSASNVRKYLLIQSYSTLSILQPNHITEIYPGGAYEVEHLNGEAIPDAKLNVDTINQVLQDMSRFYKS